MDKNVNQPLQLPAIHYTDWANSHIPEILEEIYLQNGRGVYYDYFVHKKDLTLLDVGFNIGLWSLYASRFAKHIYAFEPSKDIAAIGRKNLDANGITNVTVFEQAVAPTDGTITFYHSTNRTMFSTNPAVNDNRIKEEVPAISLETIVKNNKIETIDFMKLDVEGAESEIFTSRAFEAVVPRLNAFIYEWHTWAATNPNVINQGLREYGYVIKQIPAKATIFACIKK